MDICKAQVGLPSTPQYTGVIDKNFPYQLIYVLSLSAGKELKKGDSFIIGIGPLPLCEAEHLIR